MYRAGLIETCMCSSSEGWMFHCVVSHGSVLHADIFSDVILYSHASYCIALYCVVMYCIPWYVHDICVYLYWNLRLSAIILHCIEFLLSYCIVMDCIVMYLCLYGYLYL